MYTNLYIEKLDQLNIFIYLVSLFYIKFCDIFKYLNFIILYKKISIMPPEPLDEKNFISIIEMVS